MISSISSVSSSIFSAATQKAERSEAAGPSFGSMLAGLASQTAQSIKESEQVSLDALQGKASVQDVVMKTIAAEENLQAAMAVRDKLVSALNEITHMQI